MAGPQAGAVAGPGAEAVAGPGAEAISEAGAENKAETVQHKLIRLTNDTGSTQWQVTLEMSHGAC